MPFGVGEMMRKRAVSVIIPCGKFTPESGKSMRARLQGLHRAAFWRSLGFPNLVLARAARQRNLARRREQEARLQAQKRAGLPAFLNSTRDDL
jgi:hypothetical protein